MKMPTQEVVIWVMETKRRREGKQSIIFYLLIEYQTLILSSLELDLVFLETILVWKVRL